MIWDQRSQTKHDQTARGNFQDLQGLRLDCQNLSQYEILGTQRAKDNWKIWVPGSYKILLLILFVPSKERLPRRRWSGSLRAAIKFVSLASSRWFLFCFKMANTSAIMSSSSRMVGHKAQLQVYWDTEARTNESSSAPVLCFPRFYTPWMAPRTGSSSVQWCGTLHRSASTFYASKQCINSNNQSFGGVPIWKR